MEIDIKALITADPDCFMKQIRKVRAFSVLSDDELMKIVSQMKSFEFKAGTTLVNQGESANLFFIVHKGKVEVSVKKFFSGRKKSQSSNREISLVKVSWSRIPSGPLP